MAREEGGPVGRETLIRALLLAERYSVDITQVAAATLGRQRANNRDAELLLAIHRHPDATPGWLGEATSRDAASISRSLRYLADEGYVTRRQSPVDGRSSMVRLTRKGKTRIARFEHAMTSYFAEAAPLVKELVDLLRVEAPAESRPGGVLDTANELARVGAAYVDEVSAALRPFGVTDRVERFCLTLLLDRGRARPRDLVHEFGMAGNQVTQLVDGLTEAGVLARGHEDPDDRRAVVVRLTDRGEAAGNVQLEVFSRHAHRIVSALALTALD